MSRKTLIATAVGTAFAAGMAAAPVASAAENPFALTGLSSGYTLAQAEGAKPVEGKCGEGKCGGAKAKPKAAEGKCGEGKCGAKPKAKEGKCGEGKCGAKPAAKPAPAQ